MVNTNDKILSSDFIALKEIVDQEVLRRKYTGSFQPEAYATVPKKGELILIEHIENPYNEIKRINESLVSSLQIAKGNEIKSLDLNTIASIIAELKQIPINAVPNTGCQSSCTGLCYTACASGCKNTCSGSCTGGCTGCSGCGGGCSHNCSGGCVNHCAWTCDSLCGGYCYGGDCSGTCYNMSGG